MAIYAFTSETAEKDARKHGLFEELKSIAQKIELDQSFGTFDQFPAPFMKKPLGKNFRLICSKNDLGEDTIISFIRVVSRSSTDYERFTNDSNHFLSYIPSTKVLEEFHSSRIKSPVQNKPIPSEVDNLFLLNVLGRDDDSESNIYVYETPTWVQRFNSAEFKPYSDTIRMILEKIGESDLKNSEDHIQEDSRFPHIKLLAKTFADDNAIFLVAPLLAKDDEKTFVKNNKEIFEASRLTDEVKQRAIKSYPLYLVIDPQIWTSVEMDHGADNRSANLSLSPEEVTLLESVRGSFGSFPLFINGRPGSGKSTLLQYLYADYLKFYLSNKHKMDGYLPPVYLTYSEELLKDAQRHIKNIILNHYRNLVDNNTINKEDLENIDSMMLYQDFLLRHVPYEDAFKKFNPYKKFYFKDFKLFYADFRKGNHQLNKISPEIAWHIIRSYIKGMQSEFELFDSELFMELPQKRKSVTESIFKLIEEQVYPWLENLYQQNGYWDDQDLASYVRNNNFICDYYPAIFCDEAQDFTKIELEILNSCSMYHKKQVQAYDLAKVPIAFAGDPFQTLNPTGFKWESVKDLFRDSLILANNSKELKNFDFNYRPLSYNYRSAANVVRLCNLILLVRSIMFKDKDVKPQIPWGGSSQIWPVYLNIQNPWVASKFSDQPDITYILPCDEGEEGDFVANDEFLKTLQTPDVASRGVFLSSILSKGRQFPRIVLYKFSEHINKGYNLTELLDQSDHTKPDLTVEYFFNKLYVGASRPYNHLFILEANDLHENHLWGFFSSLNADFIQKYNSDEAWLHELREIDPKALLTQVTDPGFDLDSSKEDPFEVAINLADLGKSTRSPNILRQAAARLKSFENKIADALQCEALAFHYENKYSAAGDIYVKIPDYHEAIECYWRVGNFRSIANLNGGIQSVRDNVRYRVGCFIEHSSPEPVEFLPYFLDYIKSTAHFKLDENFLRLISVLLDRLVSSKSDTESFHRFVELSDLTNFVDHRKMAQLALNNGLRREAYLLLINVKPQNDLEYLRLVTEFSDSIEEKIRAHFFLHEYDEIRALVQKEDDLSMTASVSAMVLDAFIAGGVFQRALELLERLKEDSDSVEKERKIIEYYLKIMDGMILKDQEDKALQIFEAYFSFKLQKGYWQDTLKLINRKNFSVSSGVSLLISDDTRKMLHKIFLVSLVKTDDFIEKKATLSAKLEVQNYLEQWIKNIDELSSMQVLELKVLGAALEQSDSHGMALDFYGRLIKDAKSFDFVSMSHFQQRWLKMSKRRSDYFGDRDEVVKVRRIKEELKDNSRLWQIRDIDKISEKVDFSHDEIMNFLNGIPKVKSKKTNQKVINLFEVNKEKNSSVMKCTVPLNFGPKTTSLTFTYYKDKYKWMLQKKDDMVVYDLKKKLLTDENWIESETGIWCNEDWEVVLEITDRILIIHSKKERLRVLAEIELFDRSVV